MADTPPPAKSRRKQSASVDAQLNALVRRTQIVKRRIGMVLLLAIVAAILLVAVFR
jgi:hypothetical protein